MGPVVVPEPLARAKASVEARFNSAAHVSLVVEEAPRRLVDVLPPAEDVPIYHDRDVHAERFRDDPGGGVQDARDKKEPRAGEVGEEVLAWEIAPHDEVPSEGKVQDLPPTDEQPGEIHLTTHDIEASLGQLPVLPPLFGGPRQADVDEVELLLLLAALTDDPRVGEVRLADQLQWDPCGDVSVRLAKAVAPALTQWAVIRQCPLVDHWEGFVASEAHEAECVAQIVVEASIRGSA
jgi:hypothetical protein